MAEDSDQLTTLSARPPRVTVISTLTTDSHSPDRLLLDAARNDNVDQLDEVFAKNGKFDINFQDG